MNGAHSQEGYRDINKLLLTTFSQPLFSQIPLAAPPTTFQEPLLDWLLTPMP